MREITFDIETRMTSLSRGRLDVNQLELTVVGVHDSHTDEYKAYFRDDLPQLWPTIERADVLIGYNSDYFDIPLLNRYYPGDLTRVRSIDLMAEVYKALGRRLRLDALAQATLGHGKIGDGAKAGEWWEEGLHDKVAEYCLMDVRLTRELYDYAVKNKSLKYKELNQVKEIKLATDGWLVAARPATLTHTLPF